MEPDVALPSVMLFAVSSNSKQLWKLSTRVRAAGQVSRLDYAAGPYNYKVELIRVFSVPRITHLPWMSELRVYSARWYSH